jgi:hypothetical protein
MIVFGQVSMAPANTYMFVEQQLLDQMMLTVIPAE